MSRRLLTIGALTALVAGMALAFGVPAEAAPARKAVVGNGGELFFVREGTDGEIFPGQGLAAPDAPALAVEVVHSDGRRDVLRVPGSELVDAVNSATLLYEDESETLFVLYQTRTSIHWRLNLVGFRSGEWTEPIEISGNTFVWKSSPQIAVTRDSFQTEEADGTLRTWQRTIVHLLWWEEGSSGEPLVYYSPVVLLDGLYTGRNPVLRLDELEVGSGTGAATGQNYRLAQAPRIEPGRNGQSVVVGFAHPQTGELITLTSEVLPGEFAFIADKIRHQIVDIGRESKPDQPGSLSDKIRHQIIDIGSRLGLHPSVPSYAGQLAAAEIESAPAEEDATSLADRIRHQIVDIGARMTNRGYDRGRSSRKLQVLEIPNGEDNGSPPNLIRLVQASVRPSPWTGDGETTVFLSQDGREVVVSWLEGGGVRYRESRGEGWSSTRTLRLGEDLDLLRAFEILEQRADERTAEHPVDPGAAEPSS